MGTTEDRASRVEARRAWVEPSLRLGRGTLTGHDAGQAMGYYNHWVDHNRTQPARERVLLTGTLQAGTCTYLAGIIPKRRWIFLSRDGSLWLADKHQTRIKSSDPAGLGREGLFIWSDMHLRLIEDALCPRVEIDVVRNTAGRYQEIVRALVDERLRTCASLGVKRKTLDYARGVNELWGERDLTSPRYPSLKHAVLTSLVLSLDANVAGELIELGSLMEFRMGIITKQIAISIYHQAVRVLVQLCPAWHLHGHLMDWKAHGSIDKHVRWHWTRMLEDAYLRQGTLAEHLDKLVEE